MYNTTLNVLRVALFSILILAAIIFGATDSSDCGYDAEPICQEPATEPSTEPTAAPTNAPEPTETEPPTDTTPPETEPSVATEPATEPPTEPTETEPPYSPEELDMLALVIYQEAGADYYSDTTRLMVGTVVMNRIADDRFPDTMYEVLTQESQYGLLHWTGLVWPKRASLPEEAHAVERAYELAERILLGERALPADVVWQAEFVQGTEIVYQSKDMYFCR